MAECSTEITKSCSRCPFVGPVGAFPKDKAFSLGVRPECKKCYNDYRRKLFAEASPEKKRAKNQKTIARHKKRYHSDPEFRAYVMRKTRETTVRRDYGLEPEDVATMMELQNYKCRMCGRDISKKRNIDHLHGTKTVRGLLCPSCNRGLGLLQDSPSVMMNTVIHLCVGSVS